MTKEQEIVKAKLNLSQHRAFWWFIDDLQEYIGKEHNIHEQIKAILNLYKKEMPEEHRYRQGKLPL